MYMALTSKADMGYEECCREGLRNIFSHLDF